MTSTKDAVLSQGGIPSSSASGRRKPAARNKIINDTTRSGKAGRQNTAAQSPLDVKSATSRRNAVAAGTIGRDDRSSFWLRGVASISIGDIPMKLGPRGSIFQRMLVMQS